jgi:indolepyruvate ferredoxin oxidoreductase alpha subunit
VSHLNITSPAQLASFCEELARADRIGFDTEFVSEDTFRPELCLIQVATKDRLAVIDPYRVEELTRLIQEAEKDLRSENGGISVIISKHPCLMSPGVAKDQASRHLKVTDGCLACGICYRDFECPAIGPEPQTGVAGIDPNLCTGCGVCLNVCPQGAIKAE